MPNETATKITLKQALSVLPPIRDGKYECPACAQWHLTVKEGGGKVLVHCFTPDCPDGAAYERLKTKVLGLKPPKISTPPSGTGLTVAQYAEAKKLPADWLERFWCSDAKYWEIPAVAFPYAQGDKINIKYRWGMGKHERRWKKGAKASLYGQWQLQEMLWEERKLANAGYCFIVEGESNTQTLLYNGFPVLGVSGAEGWKQEHAENPLLRGKRIFVIQDPDAAGEKMVSKVAASFPLGKVRNVKLPVKDASDLWLWCWEHYGFDEDSVRNEFSKGLLTAVLAAEFASPDGEVVTQGAPDGELDSIETMLASAVQPQRVEWLWSDHIPLGKLVLFYGLPDQGKSFIAIDIIARGTTGRAFPNREALLPAFDVMVCASEDDLDDTYVPRLMAAGADLDRVQFAKQTKPADKSKEAHRLALDVDLKAIEQHLTQHPAVRLVVFDPIGSYLGKLNRNKDADIRPMLEELKELAKRTRVTIIILMHFNKNSEQASIHRVSGAGAWGEVPRAAWAFVPAPVEEGEEDTGEHLMLNAKLNIVASNKRRGLKYNWDTVEVTMSDGKPEGIGKIKWLGAVADGVTLDKVMKEAKSTPGPKPVRIEAAKEFLKKELADGPKPSKEVFAAGEKAGFAADILYKAKDDLGWKARQVRGGWLWEAPVVETEEVT